MAPRLVLCTVLAACATTPPPPPPPPGPPPTFTLALVIERGSIGAQPRSACDGTLAGALAIERPDGTRDRVEIAATPVAEQACIAGLGGGGSCTPRFLDVVALAPAGGRFLVPGMYTITSDGLALSCAPTTTQVTALRLWVEHPGATPVALADGETPPAAPLPTAAAPPPTTTALEIRAHMAATQHRAEGRLEVLLVPQRPVAPRSREWTTAWGTLHLAPRSAAAILDDERGPTWIEGRAAPTDKPAALALDGKPHVVALELEDGVSGSGPAEALRAGQSGGVIASSWRILDGGLDVQATLDDGLARWRAHVARQDTAAALSARLATELAGTTTPYAFTTSTSEEYRPSWSPTKRQLTVRYVARHVREGREQRVHEVRVCPPNRPPSACRIVARRDGIFATATIAIELAYDARGALVGESAPAPAIEVTRQ